MSKSCTAENDMQCADNKWNGSRLAAKNMGAGKWRHGGGASEKEEKKPSRNGTGAEP